VTVTLVPEVVLDATGVHRDLAVLVDHVDGTIEGLIGAAHAPADAVHLTRTALAPGFVNVHSHSFQRDLRGVVEHVSHLAPEDDFWTWREAMYAAAGSLDPDRIGDVARRCFSQMREAGYTAVGEFHYVHHRPDGTPYERPNALAEAVCSAAVDVGIRIVLLLTAYERGGFGRGPDPGQRRFCDPSVEAYLARLEALQLWAADQPLVTVGAAPHSVRAVSEEWLARIAEHCADHDLVLHLHADEQPREIAETLAATGLRPIALIDRAGALTHHTTIVHGTHCDDAEIALLKERGATVCACPTTEGNLGDGYVPARRLFAAGVPICVGSDSNTILDPLAELRELEHVARRTAERRNVLVAAGDDGPAPYLLSCGWGHGAHALGLPVPVIEAGAPADLIAIDLDHAQIAGVADEHLAAAIVMAGSAALVTRSWVAGR
jgi:formimidoylglutamate deiminase